MCLGLAANLRGTIAKRILNEKEITCCTLGRYLVLIPVVGEMNQGKHPQKQLRGDIGVGKCRMVRGAVLRSQIAYHQHPLLGRGIAVNSKELTGERKALFSEGGVHGAEHGHGTQGWGIPEYPG